MLTSSVSSDPLRRRCQDRSRHARDLLREMPMKDRRESEKKQAGDNFKPWSRWDTMKGKKE